MIARRLRSKRSPGRSCAGAIALAALLAIFGCSDSASSPPALTAVAGSENSNANSAPPPDPNDGGDDESPSPAATGVQETTFDDIKFDMEPSDQFVREMLTPQIESLFGRRIRLRGYMLPALRRAGLKQFVLVRDNQECCFGPGAALFDCVLVEMADGETAKYSIRPIAVEGTFRFQELKDPVTRRHLAVFRIADGTVD